MGYLHINNLYKDQRILELPEVYALEKIHGTSAHIRFKDGKVSFFSGGVKHDQFVQLFDEEFLTTALKSFDVPDITINGEAYGGKCQAMSATYGKNLNFVVFDVRFNGKWLVVPDAENVARFLKLDFVPYERIKATLSEIDRTRDMDSIQAIRNGMGKGHIREGVVLRPIDELVDERNNRIIAKHKRAEFMETRTPRKVDPEKKVILEKAREIAKEWVTPMRFKHVLDVIKVMRHMKDKQDIDITDMKHVISAMVEDVEREAKDEIVESKAARKEIGKVTALMFKQYLADRLKEAASGINNS